MAKKAYKYKAGVGKHFHSEKDQDGNIIRRQLEPGDKIELTDQQFKAFGDKFEDPKEAAKAEKEETKTANKPAGGQQTNTLPGGQGAATSGT